MSIDTLFGQIQQLLFVIANPTNTEQIKQASAQLKQSFSDINAIPCLFRIIQTDSNQAIRQLASVECRKLIQKNDGQMWESLDVNTREEIKQTVLGMSVQEPVKIVRHSLAHTISEIAKVELLNKRWGELVQILYQACTGSDVKQREVGVYVLYQLFEVIATEMESYVPQMMQLFQTTVADQESLMVSVTTVQALGKIAEFIEDQDQSAIKQFQSLIPAIVTVLQNSLKEGDDESTCKIFEVFDSLLLLETPLLSKHFPDLINLFLSIASSHDHSDQVRCQSISFLMWAIMSARNKIGKAKLVPQMLNTMFTIATEDEINRDEDEPPRLAIQVINTIATTFPPNQVFPDVMKLAIQGVQSQSPGPRRAAMLSIAVLIEGCADFMRPHLKEVLQLVCHSLQDMDSSVRKAACTCLGALSEDFEDEVSAEHATILPLLFNLINDTDDSVHPEALSTLDVILEHLGDKIVPYIPGLMSKLVSLWGSATRKVQLSATNCIGSVAYAASNEFIPYFDGVMAQLRILLSLVDPNDLQLRSVATDCVGAVATAVGKEVFRPHLPEIMGLAVQGMQYDSTHLRQCSFVLFGVLGKLYEAEFAPYLNVIVPPILQSCNLEEGDFGVPQDNEEDIDVEEEENEKYQFASGIAQEKESSIDTLGELFMATKSAFMPFLPDSINTALSLLGHYHESLRIACATTLLKILNTAYVMGHGEEWESGLPLKITLHENVANIAKLVIEGVLAMLAEEDERMAVTQVLQAIADTLKICGPAAISQQCTGEFQGTHIDLLANQLLMILQEEHPCQGQDESFEEDDEELAELDALVLTAAADTCAAFAAAAGPMFGTYFERFFPLIAKFFKPNKPLADRSMAIGAIAEITDGLEEGCTPFVNDLMHLFMQGMQDSEDEVRSNSAFGAGVLCAHSKTDMSMFYPQLLQLLHPLFNPNSPTNMQDNACGALCRLILKHQDHVPLDVCLPILLKSLPLTKDYEENRPVFKALIMLLQAGNQFLLAHIKDLFVLFTLVVKEDQLHITVKKQLSDFLKSMHSAHPQDFEGIVGSLDQEQQQIIQGLFQ